MRASAKISDGTVRRRVSTTEMQRREETRTIFVSLKTPRRHDTDLVHSPGTSPLRRNLPIESVAPQIQFLHKFKGRHDLKLTAGGKADHVHEHVHVKVDVDVVVRLLVVVCCDRPGILGFHYLANNSPILRDAEAIARLCYDVAKT